MAKKLNSVLGVDIGSRKIKIAEVRNQGREAVVSALGMIDTPEGSVDHTGVYNSDAVGAALKQVIGESGASVSHAVVSIAGQASVLVRTLEVPKMNPAELKEHMQWEINRNIPFSESTVVSDFRPLGDDDPNSQNMDVVMAISPQSAVDTVIACIKKAGRQTAAIDVEPLGLARSLKMSHEDEYADQTVCVVDVGHKTTSINIYKGSKLLMPRQVPIGGEMFTKAIADAQGVSMDEAERLKVSEADLASLSSAGGATQAFTPYNPFADDPSGAAAPPAEDTPAAPAPVPSGSGVASSMSGVLDEFVAEIRRSLDYFRSRGGDVSRLTLCGGGGKLRGLASFLEANLGVPCDNYDPLRRLNLNAKKIAPGFVDDHRSEFAVAVGNGLHILFD
ncbi:MAG TPA: type IV pilus assembly protein PilM [Fimbriimonadaceae bacterium]|nr:type IV pilus assembly protein PilM [Fimbriimonadaceae bacterium]